MAKRRAPRVPAESASELALRDQEVVRANRELAAYFKGERTEREARAALKTIKAFVRDRERGDARSRRPLPGLRSAKPPAGGGEKEKKSARARPRKTRKVNKPRATRPAGPERVVTPNETAAAAPDND